MPKLQTCMAESYHLAYVLTSRSTWHTLVESKVIHPRYSSDCKTSWWSAATSSGLHSCHGQVTKGQQPSVRFPVFISLRFSLYSFCEISSCEMNVPGKQMGQPKHSVQDHKAHRVGTPQGLFLPPCFGSATQEGVMSEISASQNLARYGFFVSWVTSKQYHMDGALPKTSELTGWWESMIWNSWAGTAAVLQENPQLCEVPSWEGKTKHLKCDTKSFLCKLCPDTGTAVSCVLLVLLWHSPQVMLVLVTTLTASAWVLIHSLQQPLGCQTMFPSHASLSHQEDTGREAALLLLQQILQCTWVELDLMILFGSLLTQDILGVVSRVQPVRGEAWN